MRSNNPEYVDGAADGQANGQASGQASGYAEKVNQVLYSISNCVNTTTNLDELFESKTNTLIAIFYLYKLYNKTGNLWCSVSAYNMGFSRLTKYSFKSNCKHHAYVQKVKTAMREL